MRSVEIFPDQKKPTDSVVFAVEIKISSKHVPWGLFDLC